jgi:hypothetical protein
MDNGKILVSCFGFWPGAEDGKAGDGSPRTVYCVIGEKARMLKLSNGEVSDLLDPETVRKMYGPCSLRQMISYIKEARSASGGDLGIDFEMSIFAKIIANPDQYMSGEEIPVRWRDYFVVSPKKGRSAGRREDEVRGYLLAVKVEEYDISHLSVANSRRYRKQVQGAQRLLREKIREYRSTSDSAKRETLKVDIMKSLRDLEQALHLLGIPISDTEKGTSRSDADRDGRVVPMGDVRTQGQRVGRGVSTSSKKRKIGIVAFKDDGSRRTPGRPTQKLSADQKREKKSLDGSIRKLELRIGRNEAILRERRSAAGEKRKAMSDLGKARDELKKAKESLTTLLYGEPVSETPAVAHITSLPESDGVGSIAEVPVEDRVEVDPDVSVVVPAQSGVVIPFPHVAPQAVEGAQSGDGSDAGAAQVRESPATYLQAAIQCNAPTQILERMFEIREELLRLSYEFMGASSTLENVSRLDELIEQRRLLEEELKEGISELEKMLKAVKTIF